MERNSANCAKTTMPLANSPQDASAFDLTKTYTLWSGLIGGMILTLAVQGTDQFFVQRLLAARSKADASWGLFASRKSV